MKILAPLITLVAGVLACAVGISYGTFSAADTDPYGYVSQADLIANGSLRVPLSAAQSMPWPNAESSLVPPGYTLSPDAQSAVPVYSIGLPLVMGATQFITASRPAVFYVVPALGLLAVWMTYLLGRPLGNHATGAMAAVLVAASPAFLYQITQPVSDVAAMAWWTVCLALATSNSTKSSLFAGVAASLAILTRPNLVPLAAVIGAFLLLGARRESGAWHRVTLRRAALFAAGAIPGCLAVALVNDYLHGSPLRTGYAPLREMFGPEHVLPNLDRYPRWMLTSQTPFIFLGLLAPLFASTRAVWMLLSFIGGLFLLTVFYYSFGRDESGYLRFLLPLYPPLLVLSVMVFQGILGRLRLKPAVTALAATTLVTVTVVWQLSRAEGAFGLHAVEQRYVDVGRYVREALPANTVYISELHSGSIRYYADRMTINAQRLDTQSLDVAIRTFTERGQIPLIVLEDGEREPFMQRFHDQEFGRLDWPPRHRTFHGVAVSMWDPADRAQFLSGEQVPTYDILMRRPPEILPEMVPR